MASGDPLASRSNHKLKSSPLSPHQICNFLEQLSDELLVQQASASTKSKNLPDSTIKTLKKSIISSDQKHSLQIRDVNDKLGFVNLGNTCYMNSAIQCLFALPEFCQIINSRTWDMELDRTVNFRDSETGEICSKTETVTKITAPNCHACADVLNGLVEQSSTSNSSKRVKALNPLIILNEIRRADRQFSGWGQQDASEFLTTLLDKLHEETKHKVTNMPKNFIHKSCSDNLHGTDFSMNASNTALDQSICDNTQTSTPKQSPKKSKNKSKSSKNSEDKKPDILISPFSETFDGELTSTVKCLTCKKLSLTKEPFQILTLSIPFKPIEENKNIQLSKEQKDDMEVSLESQTLKQTLSRHGNENSNLNNKLVKYSKNIILHNFISATFIWIFFKIFINPVRQTYTSISNTFVEPKITLKDCINFFCKIDPLEKENMYSCDNCKKLRNGEKYYSLRKMPNILIFHLKRFRHFGDSGGYGYGSDGIKINKFVEFEEYYDFNGEKYQLHSVLMHHGSSSNFGHYTSYVRSNLDGQFYHCDDRFVEIVDKKDVLAAQAYVLFYRKILPGDQSSSFEDSDISEFPALKTSNSEVNFNTIQLQKSTKNQNDSKIYSYTQTPELTNNCSWLSNLITNFKSSNSKNVCYVSQLNIFQLIYNLKENKDISLNSDVVCKCGNVGLNVKCQALLAITTEMWQKIVDKLDNGKDHYFLETDDYCRRCAEEQIV